MNSSSFYRTTIRTPGTIVTAVATCPPRQPQLTVDCPPVGAAQVVPCSENPHPSISTSTAQTADSGKGDRFSDGQTQQVTVPAAALWDKGSGGEVSNNAFVKQQQTMKTAARTHKNLVHASVLAPPIEPILPFEGTEDISDFLAPAKPIMKPGLLRNTLFTLPTGVSFVDKILPSPADTLVEHSQYNVAYYVKLHKKCSAPGNRGQYRWPAYTPNYLGARVTLHHTSFNLESWRKHLIGYEHPELVQYLQYGFPLGLQDSPVLTPATTNHGSAYQYYPWLDKFFASGLLKGGVTGPCGSSPFPSPMISPLMTARKKPSDRRAVYDATFGANSLNNATPVDSYIGTKCIYSYPKIEDFRRIIVKSGRGCFMWKRDLSRYYLQLPSVQ